MHAMVIEEMTGTKSHLLVQKLHIKGPVGDKCLLNVAVAPMRAYEYRIPMSNRRRSFTDRQL